MSSVLPGNRNLFCNKCGNILTLTKTEPLGSRLDEKTGYQIDRGTDYTFECIKPRTGFFAFLKSKNPCSYGIMYNDVEKVYGEIRYISTEEWQENKRAKGWL